MTFCVDNNNVCPICEIITYELIHSIRTFDLASQGRWRFWWKLTNEVILSTCMCKLKLTLLGCAVCSQNIIEYFVRDVHMVIHIAWHDHSIQLLWNPVKTKSPPWIKDDHDNNTIVDMGFSKQLWQYQFIDIENINQRKTYQYTVTSSSHSV